MNDLNKIVCIFLFAFTNPLFGQITKKKAFQPLDVFELEWASQPKIAPDGSTVVYRRNRFNIMTDKAEGQLWIINSTGAKHQKLTPNESEESGAIWAPDGKRIAFVSKSNEGAEIYTYWLETNQIARLTQLKNSPSNLKWSPDGKHIFFTQFVPSPAPKIIEMPPRPKGALWAEPARVTNRLKHEADGRGYMPVGFTHIFSIPSEGGTPKQLTHGDFNHSGKFSLAPDGQSIYFSANRNDDWEYNFLNSEVYRLNIADRQIESLTQRNGPDTQPVVSPNGKRIAYVGFTDKIQTYQVQALYLMNADGSNKRVLTKALDRSVRNVRWDVSGKGLYFSYDDRGNSKIAYVSLDGDIQLIAENMGGTAIGRPYGGGSFSVSKSGTIAYTHTRPEYPADLAVVSRKNPQTKIITRLNADILGQRQLGKTESIWYTSSFDGRPIQGWIVKPPHFDSTKKYPLLVENHGGPISNYGDRFTAEIQLYAAAGYLVFYPNPRGSTSYGEAFGNLLYNNYPGQDYNDVMDGVDYLIQKGLAHEDALYVTGGSAGGIMTAWIIGKNNRFEAAVVGKPVMNWISKTLVADNYYNYANYRYPKQPWENFETYWKFSPLSLVGNIQTPTMVIVGIEDLRTPTSEAKQLYHALKLRKIESVLVELPGAFHNMAKRPSQLISKAAHTIAWFDRFNIKKN